MDLTRDQPKGAKEILGWGRAKITVKGRRELSGGLPTGGQTFSTGKKGERKGVAIP